GSSPAEHGVAVVIAAFPAATLCSTARKVVLGGVPVPGPEAVPDGGARPRGWARLAWGRGRGGALRRRALRRLRDRGGAAAGRRACVLVHVVPGQPRRRGGPPGVHGRPVRDRPRAWRARVRGRRGRGLVLRRAAQHV